MTQVSNGTSSSASKTKIKIKVDDKTVYHSAALEEPVIDNFTPEALEKTLTAFKNPESITGSVEIQVGKKKVFIVAEGRVITDDLDLIGACRNLPQDKRIDFESLLLKAQGMKLAHTTSLLLKRIEEPKRDGSLRCVGWNYIFTLQQDKLSVMAKDGRGEILNNQGFTAIATEQDKQKLAQLEEAASYMDLTETHHQPEQQYHIKMR